MFWDTLPFIIYILKLHSKIHKIVISLVTYLLIKVTHFFLNMEEVGKCKEAKNMPLSHSPIYRSPHNTYE